MSDSNAALRQKRTQRKALQAKVVASKQMENALKEKWEEERAKREDLEEQLKEMLLTECELEATAEFEAKQQEFQKLRKQMSSQTSSKQQSTDEEDSVLSSRTTKLVKKVPETQLQKSGYHFLTKRYVEVLERSGYATYEGPEPQVPVGLLVAKNPFTESCSYFELEIVNTGKIGAIAVGAVPRNYPLGYMPGWKAGSIGYHADDGGIFELESGCQTRKKVVMICKVEDKMGCGVEFDGGRCIVYFTKNGKRVFQTPFGGRSAELYPAVGMKSRGEIVKLLDCQAWRA